MIELWEVPEVGPGRHFEVRALAIDGKSSVTTALEEWRRSSPEEYSRMITGLNMLSNQERMQATMMKRISPDVRGRGIYEICNRGGGNARLFFFYPRGAATIIVLTNAFWKGKRGQAAAFEEAAALRQVYERNM